MFLSIAALCGYGAWRLRQEARGRGRGAGAAPEPPPPPAEVQELSWEDVRPVDVIGLEVGYRLVPLVDRTKGGDLLARIRGVRRKLTQELGFLVQAVHIRDNLELGPNAYRIRLAGVPIGESVVYPDRELAINPGRVFGPLTGSPRAIRPSAWKRSGSSPPCASTRSRSATPWSTRAPSSPRICPISSRRMRTSCSATKRPSSC